MARRFRNRLYHGMPEDAFSESGFAGARRMMVDESSSAFWAGKEFRSFYQISISGSGNRVFRLITPINIVFKLFEVIIDSGHAHIETFLSDGTEGGTFDTALPIIPANAMTERPLPFYDSQLDLTTGGTYTGGTRIDFFAIKAVTQSNSKASITNENGTQRGGPPGTYYYKITAQNNEPVTGSIRVRWEERP